jgi:putative NADH-flavin reductase
MRVAVFGAAGRTGRLVIDRALEAGHDVTALVRRPDVGLPQTVTLVRGDARDAAALDTGLDGAEAVASVMAIQATAEATTELSDATRAIVQAMGRRGISRIVITTNGSVFHDREVADPYRVVAIEHRRNVAMLRATSLAWTVLAPGFLTDDDASGRYDATIDTGAPGRSISRRALAAAVVDALEREDWIGHIVGVSD